MNISTGRIEYHGSSGLVISDYGELSTDKMGMDTCTAEFRIRKDYWNKLPRRLSPHPIWSYLGMDTRSVKIDGAFAVARCNYAGVTTDGVDEDANATYELLFGVSEEPIETHPNFTSTLAGTPMAPFRGSIWRHVTNHGLVAYSGADVAAVSNDNYVFAGFANNIGGQKNPFGGIESYLEGCAVTWRKTVNKKAHVEDLYKAGKIDVPDGPAPALPRGHAYNWLNLGTSVTQRGFAFTHTTEWRASGRLGWLEDIYGRA